MARKFLSLAGLTAYDAKIKAYAQSVAAAAAAGKITMQAVSTLPAVADAQSNVIYLVPNSGSGSNVKDEYILVNGAFELIGTTAVDISGKADKVASATSGNFAGLDGNGNLTDSGSKASDFAVAGHTHSDKADKVASATNGNFAGLDANGNLTDSGSKAADFATAAQGAKADTALQAADITGKADKVSGATSGNFAGLDANGNLTDSGSKASDFATAAQGALAESALQSHQDISGKADKVSSATNGNFAGLDANGNLTDSGKKASDFATAAQGAKADSALQEADMVEITYSGADNEIDALFA